MIWQRSVVAKEKVRTIEVNDCGTVFTKDNAYGNCFSIFGKYSFFLFWS